jgi:hypothetical protein
MRAAFRIWSSITSAWRSPDSSTDGTFCDALHRCLPQDYQSVLIRLLWWAY